MKKLMTTTKAVKNILEEAPETRDNDYLLWLRTIEEMTAEDIKILSFSYVIRNINFLGLPNYETVSRVRRKLQAEYPELKGEKGLIRAQNKERFIAYSRAEV